MPNLNQALVIDVEWDPAKEKINIRKHGVSFEEASSVFYDAYGLSRRDEKHSIAEERRTTIGMSNRSRVLLVVFTERHGDLIRIISARKATRTEANGYEEARRRASRG